MTVTDSTMERTEEKPRKTRSYKEITINSQKETSKMLNHITKKKSLENLTLIAHIENMRGTGNI